MRVVVQRSLESQVNVSGKVVGKIDRGLVLLVAFKNGDTIKDLEYMVKKILNLRIFEDDEGKLNKNIFDVNGSILSISQFTLYGNVEKGNRPSFIESLAFDEAKSLYEEFNKMLLKQIKVETGIFGADMKVSITNDGPVTIIIDSISK